MITVAEMMTTGTKTLTKDDSLADAQAIMEKFSCHHVPIVRNGAQLDGKAETVVVLAPTVDQSPILVIEMAMLGEFDHGQLAGKSTVLLALRLGQKFDRHRRFRASGKRRFIERCEKARF